MTATTRTNAQNQSQSQQLPPFLNRLPAPLREFILLMQQSFQEWNADNVPRIAAALSYFTAFSIAPLLVVVIAIIGLIIGARGAQDEILNRVSSEFGSDVAGLLSGALTAATQPRQGTIATILGIIGVLFAALGVFEQLKSALNTIWGVQPAQTEQNAGILGFIRTFLGQKLLSFGMILVIGFLLLVSLVINSVVAGVAAEIVRRFPDAAFLVQFINFALSFVVTTFLFAMIYKFLPDTKIEWRDVLVGAAFTSLLFSLGRLALSQYLANSGTASVYGAAGSLALVLLWVFYSAQIILFGAEFTQVYASRHGSRALTPVQKHPASAQVEHIEQVAPQIDYAARQSRQTAREILPAGEPAPKQRRGLVNLLVLVGILGSALVVGFTGRDRE